MLYLVLVIGLPVTALSCSLIYIICRNLILQKKISVIESQLKELAETCGNAFIEIDKQLKKKLSDEQLDWQNKLTKEYEEIFDEIKKDIKKENKAAREELIFKINKEKEVFDKTVKEAFDKACDQIKFDEITYKKTITKKRKEFNRKNGKDAKPKRIWRYIDED